MKSSKLSGLASILAVTFTIGIGYIAVTHSYIVTDWLKLRNYAAPAAVAQLADETTMTPAAKHLFYINRPAVETKTVFHGNCDKFGEQTIVLGCYESGQRGIHVLAVDDDRLEGVEQVTAAHEMLHAAYDRLPGKQKQRVEAMLQSYADTKLKDGRIVKALEGYKKTEPGQQLNEMHSIFGTEITVLPTELEEYYRQYFTDRKQVAAYAAAYQAAFTSRQDGIKAYDIQLKNLSQQIKNNTRSLTDQQQQIEATGRQLDGYRANGNISSYNAGVPDYNASIGIYNQLLDATKDQIDQYNQLVRSRNAIAAETTELQQAIDSSNLPQSK